MMNPGQRLYPDQQVTGGGAALRYQGDGNLVLYGPGGPLWSAGTTGAPGYVEMQGDGNLVIYDGDGTPIWASGSEGEGAKLLVARAGLKIVATRLTTLWSTPPFPADPDPDPEPGPAPEMSRLVVESNRRYFANAQGRFDWREVSRFSCLARLMRGEHGIVRELLRADKAIGFTMTRQIITLWGDYWSDFLQGPKMPGYFAGLHDLVQMHQQEGLYVRICILGALDWAGGTWEADRRDFYTGDVRRQCEAFALEVARQLAPYPNVVLEIANEPTQIGMRDSWPAIVSLGHQIKALAPNTLLCGGEDNDGRGLVAPFDFADAHLSRDMGVAGWQWIKRSGEHPVIDQTIMPFVAGEDVNMGEGRRDGRTGDVESQPANCFGAAAVHRSRRIGGQCFHWDGGLWSTPMQPITVACANAWHDGLDAFPMLMDNLWRGHWGVSRGDYWRDVWPNSDDLREVEAHIQSRRGPWRAFGCGPVSVVFPMPKNWDYRANLDAPAELVAINTDGTYDCAVFRRT